MARLIISNKDKVLDVFIEHSVSNGFNRYEKVKQEHCNLVAFKKLKVDNENLYFNDEGFIAVTGTFIYKESMIGKDALKDIYRNFKGENTITSLRNDLMGAYMFVIKKGEEIWAFSDVSNIADVYYFFDGSKWVLSNWLFDMSISLAEDLSVNEFNFIEQIFQYGIWGNGTIFNEIKKLLGNEYIHINLASLELSVNKVPDYLSIKYNTSPLENVVDDLVREFRIIGNALKKCYGNDIGVSMTGGLDSRLVLSVLYNSNIKPKLFYGIGNSQFVPTQSPDLNIVNLFSSLFDLRLNIQDWTTPDKIDKDWNELIDKYGFAANQYSGSKNFNISLETQNISFANFGYFGEIYRNIKYVENSSKEKFSVDDFISNCYIERDLTDTIPDYKLYRIHLKKKIEETCLNLGMNPQQLTPYNMAILDFTKRKTTDTELIRLSNQINYSFPILAESRLLPYVFCGNEYRKEAKLMLKIIDRLCPEMLDIPFFTRRAYKQLDRKTMSLKDKGVGQKIIRNVRKLVFAVPFGEKMYRKIAIYIRPLWLDKKTAKETLQIVKHSKDIVQVVEKYKLFNHNIDPMTSEYVSKESRYAMYLMMVAKIFEKKNV